MGFSQSGSTLDERRTLSLKIKNYSIIDMTVLQNLAPKTSQKINLFCLFLVNQQLRQTTWSITGICTSK